MKKLRLVLALLLACSGFGGLGAQIFKPFTALRVIRTEHFDFIYPAESERSARTLAAKADGIYDRVSGLLGISLERRVPVSITPHTEQFNGYMQLQPYPHIVLYDTPMSLEMTAYENSLEGLFVHELTHAISLSTRASYWKGLYAVFGGWVTPSLLTSPQFMTEGVTVSFESLGGFGRANDPLVKQQLRQDSYENVFLTPHQASGLSEYPNASGAFYEYGGLFSAWLQQTYGMEKYAQLWQRMGAEYHFSFFFYNNGYYNIFKNVYGMPILEAWSAFRESLRIDMIRENPEPPVYEGAVPGPLFSPKKGAVIPAVAAGGGKVYFLDTLARGVLCYDPVSGKISRAVSTDTAAYALDVSPDGERLLVSSYHYAGNLARAVVTEYTVKGWQTGRSYRGLYSARYFRDGVVGLSSDLHDNRLVYRPGGKGAVDQVLLRGDEELLYGSPSPVNGSWIAFVAAKSGKRELCLYNFDTQAVYTLGDEDRWRHIRSVQASPGYLLFAFNHDEGMYKLGAVDVSGLSGDVLSEGLEAVFTERDFSGGVSLPVAAGGEIFYRGAFSRFDALLRYPENAAVLSGARMSLSLRPWTTEDLARAVPSARPPDLPAASLPSKRYAGISYMNPLKFWLPMPLVRATDDDFGISFDGVGILSGMSDPTDTNMVILNANFDIRSLMAAGWLQWTNYGLGFPLQLYLSDDLDKTGATIRRITQVSLSADLSFGLGGERLRFQASPGVGAQVYTKDSGDGAHPYSWDYGQPYFVGGLGLGISSLIRPSWTLFGQGFSLAAYGKLLLNPPALGFRMPRLEATFTAAFEPWVPLRLRLYGAWDQDGMDLHGQSSYFVGTAFDDVASAEYSAPDGMALEWIAGGEAELKLFSLDIQKGLSHLYYNRVYGTLAYRGAAYDDQGYSGAEGTALGGSFRLAQSVLLRLGMVISTVFVPALPVSITPYVWGAWKFPNLDDGNDGNDFKIGFDFSISY